MVAFNYVPHYQSYWVGTLFLGQTPLPRLGRRQRKTSWQLCNLNTLWNILMILGRNVGRDDLSHRRLTTLPFFLLLELSPFVLFEKDFMFYFKKILCPLCNSNTLRNISMVLGRNVEQDETACHIQE